MNIAEAVSAGSRPADNFLFIHTTDADHDAFNKIISWVALLEMILVALAAGMSWRDKTSQAEAWREDRGVWTSLADLGGACSLLMFPVTAVFWRILPKLQFMQFPWRWLLCLSMIFTVFVTVGLRRWWTRAAVVVVSIVVIVAAWHRVQTPWWDNAGDLREMQDNMSDRRGVRGHG